MSLVNGDLKFYKETEPDPPGCIGGPLVSWDDFKEHKTVVINGGVSQELARLSREYRELNNPNTRYLM